MKFTRHNINITIRKIVQVKIDHLKQRQADEFVTTLFGKDLKTPNETSCKSMMVANQEPPYK